MQSRPAPPIGLRRMLFRLPIHLYRARLGWVFGKRMALVTHVGRKTGRVRQVVIEVAGRDRDSGALTVASGFGPNADWYRNLLAHPEITVQLGTRSMAVLAVPLSTEEGARAMVDYAHRHPRSARGLARFMGFTVSGGDEDYRSIGREIPFVRLEPRHGA